VQILKEIVPAASKVAVLINPDDQNAFLQMQNAKLAADKLGGQAGTGTAYSFGR
jgi:ABC-type uncharacterized transport system substrate-binding protein